MRKFKRNDFGGLFGNSILQFVILAWIVGELFPLMWLTYSAFKTEKEILLSPFGFPTSFYLGNFNFARWQEVFNINFLVLLKNSVAIAVIGLFLLILVSLLAGYAIAKLKVFGKNIILLTLIVIIAIPVHALIIPLYYFVAKLGLLNNYFGYEFG